MNQKVTKNVSFDATINYSNTNKKGAGTSGDSGRFNMLAQILSARPTGGLALTNEELLAAAIDPLELESSESLAQVNPIMQTQSVTNTKRSEMWSGNLSVTWEIIKGLTFKTAGTYNTTNTVRIFSIRMVRKKPTVTDRNLMVRLKWDVTSVGRTITTLPGNRKSKSILMT